MDLNLLVLINQGKRIIMEVKQKIHNILQEAISCSQINWVKKHNYEVWLNPQLCGDLYHIVKEWVPKPKAKGNKYATNNTAYSN